MGLGIGEYKYRGDGNIGEKGGEGEKVAFPPAPIGSGSAPDRISWIFTILKK